MITCLLEDTLAQRLTKSNKILVLYEFYDICGYSFS